MKTLNRPMFRYGGPIKEGVMNGIREPKKDGGSMGNNLVGSNAYPKTDGREHHFVVSGTVAAGVAANAARIAAMRAAATYGPRAIGGIKKGIGAIKNMFGKNVPKNVTVPKGFPFNGANVPRLLWIFVSPFKPVNLVPVVFHDYLCSIKDYDLADEYFDELLDLVDEEVFKDVMVKAVDLYNKLIRNRTNTK